MFTRRRNLGRTTYTVYKKETDWYMIGGVGAAIIFILAALSG